LALVGLPALAHAQAFPYNAFAGTWAQGNAPVSVSGGTATEGGSARAGATLGAETHAFAAPTNTLSSSTAFYPAQSSATYSDIIISGPTPTVLVTLHIPFHANFIDQWSAWTGDFPFHTFAAHNANFQAALVGATSGFPVGGLTTEFNRAEDVENLLPSISGDATEAHTFTRTAFTVTPVTSDPSVGVFAGSLVDEIYELRGEFTLTGTVPTGVPLTLNLSLDINSTAHSFFIAGAGGSTDARDTLGVPQGGVAVFDLPAGYTSNSVSLGIVDNVVPANTGGSLPCPRPQGDWKNASVWPVTSLTLGTHTYSQTDLLKILRAPIGSGNNADASLILADQLIAAKLNVANGADAAPVSASIATADALLSAYSGTLGYKVKPSSAAGKQMTAVAAELERYNTRLLTVGCIQ
jgi:hypothetical protein